MMSESHKHHTGALKIHFLSVFFSVNGIELTYTMIFVGRESLLAEMGRLIACDEQSAAVSQSNGPKPGRFYRCV
jgi:hypothetical protein